MPRQVLTQCARDAKQIDATRERLRGCQRELDGRAGQLSLLQQEVRELDAQIRQSQDELSRLKARPGFWSGAVAGALVAGALWLGSALL